MPAAAAAADMAAAEAAAALTAAAARCAPLPMPVLGPAPTPCCGPSWTAPVAAPRDRPAAGIACPRSAACASAEAPSSDGAVGRAELGGVVCRGTAGPPWRTQAAARMRQRGQRHGVVWVSTNACLKSMHQSHGAGRVSTNACLKSMHQSFTVLTGRSRVPTLSHLLFF